MEKVILYSDSKVVLIRKADDSYRLPVAEEVGFNKNEAELFRFAEYVAVPLNLSSCKSSFNITLSDELIFNRQFPKPSSLNYEIVGLRESWQLLPEKDYRAAAKGAELLNWSNTTRFCSTCGTKLRRASDISKICPECKREVFPSLWPAIVVLVIKESPDGDSSKEEALLVHARTLSRPTVQTLVAGFVETGESLEECVAREVKEETDIEIEDIRYVGSQSWPFPHQLMLGFTARYKRGELKFADGELTAGGFFRRDNLPDLPTLPSLSRRIINAWSGM
ncbi:MAG: NAD(+) diphosphatase [Muribaculaceae bacterium]|nr:NAD(+) diphosphatase [Muribaculaceae bacterium]